MRVAAPSRDDARSSTAGVSDTLSRAAARTLANRSSSRGVADADGASARELACIRFALGAGPAAVLAGDPPRRGWTDAGWGAAGEAVEIGTPFMAAGYRFNCSVSTSTSSETVIVRELAW